MNNVVLNYNPADVRLEELRLDRVAQELVPLQALEADGRPRGGVEDTLFHRRIGIVRPERVGGGVHGAKYA